MESIIVIVYADYGISIYTGHTCQEAIDIARKMMLVANDIKAVKIAFSDGTYALWNEYQKSDCLR